MIKRPLSTQQTPAEAAQAGLANFLITPTAGACSPQAKSRHVLLTAQHNLCGQSNPTGEAEGMGRGCQHWAESSEALALDVWSPLEGIPDKEERGGPSLSSRGLVILLGADPWFWGVSAESEETSRVWSTSERTCRAVGRRAVGPGERMI